MSSISIKRRFLLLVLLAPLVPVWAGAETVAIIGTGEVGSALPEFAAPGHTVVYGSRQIVTGMGLEPIDLGPLRHARHVEGMLILWINAEATGGEAFDYHLRKVPGE